MSCPVCRADGNREPQCRRCKADLTLVVQVDRTRARAMTHAIFHARCGDARACLANASTAHRLRAGADSARLLAVGSLLARDFRSAWFWAQKARQWPHTSSSNSSVSSR